MKVTRRAMIAGSLAVPTLAGLAGWRWRHGDGNTVLLHDPDLALARRFAAAGRDAGADVRAIAGDRIRFARDALAHRPALVAAITRHADALLIAEVAAEAGYAIATEMRGDGVACEGTTCDPGWVALNRLAVGAGGAWPEALAGWAADPAATQLPRFEQSAPVAGAERVFAFVLAPRG